MEKHSLPLASNDTKRRDKSLYKKNNDEFEFISDELLNKNNGISLVLDTIKNSSILSDSLIYSYENNINHFGNNGKRIYEFIKSDKEYLEFLRVAILTLQGEDNLFKAFLKEAKSVYVVRFKINNQKPVAITSGEEDEHIRAIYTTNLKKTIIELRKFLKDNFSKELIEFNRKKEFMEDSAYMRININDEKYKLLIIKMLKNAIMVEFNSLNFPGSNKENIRSNITFYQRVIAQLNKDSKDCGFTLHCAFFELITYALYLKLNIYKEDLEYKRLLHHFQIIANVKKYQELSDEEYLERSRMYKKLHESFLEIREKNKVPIDFYTKLFYMYNNLDEDIVRKDKIERVLMDGKENKKKTKKYSIP